MPVTIDFLNVRTWGLHRHRTVIHHASGRVSVRIVIDDTIATTYTVDHGERL